MNLYTYILFLVILILSYIVYKLFRKLMQFDDIFTLLVEDIDIQINHIEKNILNSVILSDEPQVVHAYKNFKVMRDRLNEFVLQIKEASNVEIEEEELNKRIGDTQLDERQ